LPIIRTMIIIKIKILEEIMGSITINEGVDLGQIPEDVQGEEEAMIGTMKIQMVASISRMRDMTVGKVVGVLVAQAF